MELFGGIFRDFERIFLNFFKYGMGSWYRFFLWILVFVWRFFMKYLIYVLIVFGFFCVGGVSLV